MKLNKKLIIGTAQLDKNYGIKKNRKKIDTQKLKSIFNFLKKKNYFYIDTARSYKGAENLLKTQDLSKFKIIGKVEKLREKKNIYSFLKKRIMTSLNNLDIKRFEGYLIHDEADLISDKSNEIYEALLKIKNENLTRKVGVSVYNFRNALAIIKNFKLDIIQLPYNILDRRFEKKIFLKEIKKKNIEVHARSIFLQGLLLYKINKIPNYFTKYLKNLKKIDEFCEKNNLSKLEFCLNFVLQNKFIDKLVIGIEDKKNIYEISRVKYTKNNKRFPNIDSNNLNLIDPRKWKNL
jgi:aryl-alcohol dehydrogenase-like predicted oxidoreductase